MVKFLAIPHIVTSLILMAVSLPLVKGRIKRNAFYGVRIREAFQSEERWLEINRYGGRLLLRLAMVLLVVAGIGLFLPNSFEFFLAYAFGSLLVMMAGLGIVVVRTLRYAKRTAKE